MALLGFLGHLRARFGRLSGEEARRLLLDKYEAYRRLVDANTRVLQLMADMQSNATGEFAFDRAYAEGSMARLKDLSGTVVESLSHLSGGRHAALGPVLDQVLREANLALEGTVPPATGPAVLDLDSLGKAPAGVAGGKIRRLAELRADIGLPVPDGFCITTSACGRYLRQGDLMRSISSELDSISLRDKEELSRASAAIRSMVLGAGWPEPAGRAILDSFDALERKLGGPLQVSVRSSAVGEDGEFSFAGQFDSVLNVDRRSLLKTCQEVLASQFGPRALVYFKAKGMNEGVTPMAIGVLAMVDARSSGVLYTRDPQDPEADSMTIAGQWGLGGPTVDGSEPPDLFRLSGRPDPKPVEIKIARKAHMLLCGPGSGLVQVDVPGWMQEESCLTADQLSQLGSFGHRLEEHFGRAQDVEWALDSKNALYLLQSRPLRTLAPARPAEDLMTRRAGLVPLLSQGVVACRGCASGPVHLLRTEEDIRAVPYGAVVVAPFASPLLAEAVDRAVAFVTDRGSAASHLATVAREFGVPALLGTGSATAILSQGMTVTVDGEMGNVYEGRVEALLNAPRRVPPEADEPLLYKRFREALLHVTPLNLTDPRRPGFKASRCKTLHDIVRFAHEAAVREMFDAGRLATRGARNAVKLATSLPVAFYFVDLGGGLRAGPGSRTVTPEDFLCRPLVPLWKGMSGTPWGTGAAAGARGMASVLSSSLVAREAMREAAEPNYAIVSDSYLNLSFRLGYHFSRVDAYLGERAEENYASFLFQGGAAGAAGRSRRVRFMKGALERTGFGIHTREDALFARTQQVPAQEMALRLEALGRLMVATRQADTLFTDDGAVERALAAFQSGDFTLGLTDREEGES